MAGPDRGAGDGMVTTQGLVTDRYKSVFESNVNRVRTMVEDVVITSAIAPLDRWEFAADNGLSLYLNFQP